MSNMAKRIYAEDLARAWDHDPSEWSSYELYEWAEISGYRWVEDELSWVPEDEQPENGQGEA